MEYYISVLLTREGKMEAMLPDSASLVPILILLLIGFTITNRMFNRPEKKKKEERKPRRDGQGNHCPTCGRPYGH